MTSPLMSVQDSQTEASLAVLAESTDNVALQIGRLSKSIDDLSALFEEGGAGYGLATNAPGRFTADQYSSQSVIGGLHAIGTAGFKGVLEPWNIGNVVSSIGKSLFGGLWQTKAAGMALSVDQGDILAQDYLYRKNQAACSAAASLSTSTATMTRQRPTWPR